jgi:hypothetical protein
LGNISSGNPVLRIVPSTCAEYRGDADDGLRSIHAYEPRGNAKGERMFNFSQVIIGGHRQ